MEHSNLIDKLVEINLLSTENGKIKLKPHDQYSFTTYPLDDEYILVTEEEYIGLLMHIYMFNDDLDAVIDYVEPIEEEPQGE